MNCLGSRLRNVVYGKMHGTYNVIPPDAPSFMDDAEPYPEVASGWYLEGVLRVLFAGTWQCLTVPVLREDKLDGLITEQLSIGLFAPVAVFRRVTLLRKAVQHRVDAAAPAMFKPYLGKAVVLLDFMPARVDTSPRGLLLANRLMGED